jgi:AcrR family transcriptional regulator
MTLQEIRKNLPTGAIKEIAKRANTSETTVSLLFKGKTNSLRKQEILQITADFLKEYKTREREAKEAISEALNGI